MLTFVDMRWFLLVPALLGLGFLIWVFVNLAREGMRKQGRGWTDSVRRRDKGGTWE